MTPRHPAAGSDWFVGGGEMGARIRAYDWSRTPLGAIESWPQSLRSAVSILLPSRAQICLFWGPDLVAIYNDAYRPTLGIKHPRALGQPAREVWSEFWEDVLRPLLEGVLHTGEAFWGSDYPFFLQRLGYPEETYFDVSYDPVRDESGAVGGVFCIVTETTGRVVGERRLRGLSTLGRIATQARTVSAVFQQAGEVLGANAEDVAFALLYQRLPADGSVRLCAAAGIPAGHPVAGGNASAAWPFDRASGPQGVILEGEALRGLGTLPGGRWPEPCARVVVLPIALPSQPPEGFLVAGVSPRRPFDAAYRGYLELIASSLANAIASAKALEDERRRGEALAQLDRAKTMFFSNISHEFRTPLTLLLGPLRDELSRDGRPSEARVAMELAYRNGLRLLKLVNALLDFSRIEAGRMLARYEPTDLRAFTAELASNFESACERAGLALRVRFDALPEAAYVDRDMWEKIVLNLISNAFKYTFEGAIEVSLRAEGQQAVLAVRDTGVGIAPEAMPRIFERFHRIEGTRARTHEGSGIGLALVHELVRMHCGDIRVDSRQGGGSLFEVRLPLGRAHLPPEQVHESSSAEAGAGQAPMFVQEAMGWLRGQSHEGQEFGRMSGDRGRERILVAEDNADMREYIERLLGEFWEVVAVGDGEAAMHALFTARFDLLLTDVMMPRMDGFGLLRAVRSDESLRELPVVMLSARAGEEARIEGREAGADDYLVKPFSARELVAQVRAQLAMSRARRAVARERELLLASERGARMEAQRQWEDLVRLFEQAPNPMVILRGREHVIELANPAACRVWGRSAEQVTHKPLFDALPEARGQGLEEMLAGVLESGKPYLGNRVPVGLDRGRGIETVYFDFVYSPLRGASGRIEGVAVTAFDVTQHASAARKDLAESR